MKSFGTCGRVLSQAMVGGLPVSTDDSVPDAAVSSSAKIDMEISVKHAGNISVETAPLDTREGMGSSVNFPKNIGPIAQPANANFLSSLVTQVTASHPAPSDFR